jgi:ATP-binding cassette, subfamily B, bacterial
MREPPGRPTVDRAMTEPPPARASLATLRRLAPYVRPHRLTLLAGGAAALAGTLAGLTIPLVTRAIVDGPIAHGELTTLPWLVLGVLGLGVPSRPC